MNLAQPAFDLSLWPDRDAIEYAVLHPAAFASIARKHVGRIDSRFADLIERCARARNGQDLLETMERELGAVHDFYCDVCAAWWEFNDRQTAKFGSTRGMVPARAVGALRAIPTEYAGRKFRSRLEARWAVFLDVLDIEWRYEAEGFRLSNGDGYLPDFHLPRFNGGCWIEVKPPGGNFDKALRFAKESRSAVIFAEGEPQSRVLRAADYRGAAEDLGAEPLGELDVAFDEYVATENRFFWLTGEPVGSFHDGGAEVSRAVAAALSARFGT
jgi:hypothetical protein